MVNSAYTRKLGDIHACDIISVGGKNAILGDMYSKLSPLGINVPDGFAVTSFAFEHFLTANVLHQRLHELMHQLDRETFSNLKEIGAAARAMILAGTIPYYMIVAIREAYDELCHSEGEQVSVAVRSSASAENLPLASFVGLHESFLNIDDADTLLDSIKKCFASLYTDRAIKYREDNHFTHAKLFFSVGVQKMVQSRCGASGMIIELDGTGDMLDVSAVKGFCKDIVKMTRPDHYLVFKPALELGKNPILRKRSGRKKEQPSQVDKEVFVAEPVLPEFPNYILTDDEIAMLAKWASIICEHYGKSMDIEWAKDGNTGKLYIVRARPRRQQVCNTIPIKKAVSW
ncbi:PEP/pyruvate-binding domain-containing protein [Pinibacter soli]|uniref:Phosphoenolpyruvate synthase n=1 Tax=Pinibacter soli TaxID=3044211 RepID=A0ABT6RFC9_9BACT|nr:PEP/pyruvate-binding domain-containing protein [Pinibacter soli]MDI3321260.1 PEP/pyruvate-binding domain-containing protein [Pinibacter soli]